MKDTVIWRFSDGRPGHDQQSLGLVNALRERRSVTECRLDVTGSGRSAWWWFGMRYPPGKTLPRPELLLGAGHATHPHLLAARRRFGGRCVVLMKPSLPRAWFDLCIVPEHDAPSSVDNQLITRGVLNTMRWSHEHSDDVGLVVIGGPSRHYDWDDDVLLQQLEQLVLARPGRRWWVTSSPRTPAEFFERVAGLLSGVECVPFGQTSPEWLAQRMAEAGEVWVSEDSVSMVYEALGSGARVGLLKVRRRGSSRVTRGVDQLVNEGWVGVPGEMQLAKRPGRVLNEADRCAQWIDEQWLNAD